MVGLLIDNSLSMRLTREDGGPRRDFITTRLDETDGDLLRAVQHRLQARLFAFGARARGIDSVSALDFDDGDSNLAAALAQVRESLAGEPLAGLVILTDGALQSDAALDAELLALREAGIPLFSVGLGDNAYPRDLEISRVGLPRQVLADSRVFAEVSIRQSGYDDEPVELIVEDDNRILHRQSLQLRPGLQTIRIPLEAAEAGARRLDFRLATHSDEALAGNNTRAAMLAVDDRPRRVLYFEGEPRFEMKFVRRAVAGDEGLGISGLIRTADAKYYRVGIEHRDELRDGFPTTAEELFAYDAIILGSVDRTLLSHDQQQLIYDFVDRRGGGLLLLGGRHAYSEGGYHESPLRDLFPVVLPPIADAEFSHDARLEPTAAAWVHPALALADDGDASIERWLTLPPLTLVNPIRRVKPGATLLLAGSDAGGEPLVGMAWQHYGRGKVVAFPVQNSWLWQMHQDIELEDQSHERLWRQLLRWLVEDVPPRLDLELTNQRVHTDGQVSLRAELLDSALGSPTDTLVQAIVTSPDGIEQIIPMTPHAALPGIYQAQFAAAASGDFFAHLEFDSPTGLVRSREARFEVRPEGNELFQSEMNEALLQRMAA